MDEIHTRDAILKDEGKLEVYVTTLFGPQFSDYSELPPFDENVRCSKCGYDAVKTKHGVAQIPCRVPPTFESKDMVPMPEPSLSALLRAGWTTSDNARFYRSYLKRTCARCEYRWDEACVPGQIVELRCSTCKVVPGGVGLEDGDTCPMCGRGIMRKEKSDAV